MTKNTAQRTPENELRAIPTISKEATIIQLPIVTDDQGTANIKMPPLQIAIFKGKDNDCL